MVSDTIFLLIMMAAEGTDVSLMHVMHVVVEKHVVIHM